VKGRISVDFSPFLNPVPSRRPDKKRKEGERRKPFSICLLPAPFLCRKTSPFGSPIRRIYRKKKGEKKKKKRKMEG